MTDNLPEWDKIRALRDGNEGVFQQTFDSCYEDLCRYALTLLRDKDEAEDTVQSMFMKLWEKREVLDIKQSIRSYLFRSVYNQCMNQIEHRAVKKKHQEIETMELSSTIQPEVFTDELHKAIRQAIDELPPQCKTIFIMSRFEELRYPEIAEKLDISTNTIQNQICKALKILREKLRNVRVGD